MSEHDDTMGVPVGAINAGAVVGFEAQALAAGMAAVERAMAPTAAQQAVAAMRPRRHVQRVEVRCLDCGWVQSYGFAASEPREMKRIAFVGDQSRCPRCYARRCVQGGAA